MGLLDFSQFGVKNLYDQPEKKEKAKADSAGNAGAGGNAAAAPKPKTKEEIELELLFPKSYTCPVCGNKFTEKKVRSGKMKLLGTDLMLRARYEQLEPLKYGTAVCHKCGYAALDRFFEGLTAPQKKLISENVTPNYKDQPAPEGIQSYEYALEMHKLALLNAVVKKGRSSERAFICLKMAWLCQSRIENLPEDAPDRDAIIKECQADIKELYKNACEGFATAISTEPFPMCGMDDMTVTYLVAALYMETGEYDKALKMLSEIISSHSAKNTLKDKARDLKEELNNRKK